MGHVFRPKMIRALYNRRSIALIHLAPAPKTADAITPRVHTTRNFWHVHACQHAAAMLGPLKCCSAAITFVTWSWAPKSITRCNEAGTDDDNMVFSPGHMLQHYLACCLLLSSTVFPAALSTVMARTFLCKHSFGSSRLLAISDVQLRTNKIGFHCRALFAAASCSPLKMRVVGLRTSVSLQSSVGTYATHKAQ